MKKICVVFLFGVTSAISFAVGAQTGAITVETRTGLTVETCLGHNICINKGATTKLVHHFLFNPAMPAVCSKVPEVETRYETSTRSSTGQYLYKAGCSLIPDQAIDAYELKFVVFDIFGRHVRTLVAAAIRPIAEKDPFFVSGTWNLYSENEVGLHYMSVAYVSRLKLATGRVVVADDKAVAAAIRKLTNTFDEGQLAPKAPTPQ
jgi:hypothetical protein